jgi:Protein of unknown function (DUF3619)
MKHSISYRRPADPEALQARFALRVAARLDERAGDLGPDVAERLRFAREQALEKARAARTAAVMTADAPRPVGGATLAWTGGRGDASSLWVKIGSVLPLIVLVAGLILIQQWNVRAQIDAAAEIDAALLSDSLPPSAYSDPGFAEFLNTPRD